jgi:methylenetetrahydrofolate dehydrogenase (NADP+)/methenyltetrahydrofolate cyclohydrolase
MKQPEDITEYDLVDKIIDVSEKCNPCSIILQMPIPKHLNADRIINVCTQQEDVDGLSIWNKRWGQSDKTMKPCTPLGIMELLHHYDIPIAGKHCVIIGRSEIVGKPLSQMMLDEDATVTICHSKTDNLAEITRTADILVSAVGKPKLITADMVKADCTVIDVGINRVNGKLCGDVDFDEVSKKVKYITPVPGGIGLLTRAMLMANVVKSHKLQLNN